MSRQAHLDVPDPLPAIIVLEITTFATGRAFMSVAGIAHHLGVATSSIPSAIEEMIWARGEGEKQHR